MSAQISTGIYIQTITTSINRGLADENQLALMEFLKKKGLADGQELSEIDPAEAKAIGFSVSQESASNMATQAPSSEDVTKEFTRVDIQGNTAGDNMTTITGNIGYESGHTASYNGTSAFRNNKLGNNGTLLTGDIGGQAALDMMNRLFTK